MYIYIYIYIHTHTYIIRTNIHMHSMYGWGGRFVGSISEVSDARNGSHTGMFYTHLKVYAFMCVYVWMNICQKLVMRETNCTLACMHVNVYACMHACMHVCKGMHACVRNMAMREMDRTLVHMHLKYMYANACDGRNGSHTGMYARVSVCMCVWMCANACVHACVRNTAMREVSETRQCKKWITRWYISTWNVCNICIVHVCMHVCIRVYIFVIHVHVLAHRCASWHEHVHTRTHTHAHINTNSRARTQNQNISTSKQRVVLWKPIQTLITSTSRRTRIKAKITVARTILMLLLYRIVATWVQT